MRPFDAALAATVASWVRSQQELRWLAPDAGPTLTSAMVIEWGVALGHRAFGFEAGESHRLIGYGELNDMPNRHDQMWIGHVLIDPPLRGRSLGQRVVRRLLDHAFEQCGAREVVLVVVPENAPAIRCYEAAGMSVVAEEFRRNPHTQATYRLLRMNVGRWEYEAGRAQARGEQ